MTKSIKLFYNPQITPEVIKEICQKNFPEYKIKKAFLNKSAFTIRKSAYIEAMVMIHHIEKQNQTVITISKNMTFWAVLTGAILAPIGFVIMYIIILSIKNPVLKDVDTAIRRELL